MARPREFSVEDALDSAMDVFWREGYEASSLADLLAAMGIARGSFYKAFHDKRSLYLSALDLYDQTVVTRAAVFLANGDGDGAERLAWLLLKPSDDVKNETRRGCFLCNAAVDRTRADAEIETAVVTMLTRFEDGIAAAIADSAVGASWSPAKRKAAAGHLLSLYMGLRVQAKAGRDAGTLEIAAKSALNDLGLGR